MSSFDRLHPALQYHVVNSLGWASLRPMQERSIEPILDGDHVLILAPTAGGKTEAAILPVLSKVLSENRTGTTVLYLCPLKALLNDLGQRLERLSAMVGRTTRVWHGDVAASTKSRIPFERPDILLTTPESLEAMLLAKDPARREMLSEIQTVIVDELHSFGGDDRGWHLLAVLARIAELPRAMRQQRIGLSATVGAPDELLRWLTSDIPGKRMLVAPAEVVPTEIDLQIDFVGSLKSAAIVISRLHAGEKRLVFCDSRSRVEELAAMLREAGTVTFVSHGSLAAAERREAEAAFSEGRNCVIVATSTLELGIDVGNLDRVIQVDAPGSVASFLQRAGRSGRRQGARRNMLLLATDEEALLRGCAVVKSWREGFVEPIAAPPAPYHIVAQQALARVLQAGRIPRGVMLESLCRFAGIAGIDACDVRAIVDFMIAGSVLTDENGVLFVGPRGESEYGRKNFVGLMAVFSAPPSVSVVHGNVEIGTVGEQSIFASKQGEPIHLTLAGRHWTVVSIEWNKRVVQVVPAAEKGRSKWFGFGSTLRFETARAMARVIANSAPALPTTVRATRKLDEVRSQMSFIRSDDTCIAMADGVMRWWTFAGARANQQLTVVAIGARCLVTASGDHAVGLQEPSDAAAIVDAIAAQGADKIEFPIDSRMRDGVKFKECVPDSLIDRMLQARWRDPNALRWISTANRRIVFEGDSTPGL